MKRVLAIGLVMSMLVSITGCDKDNEKKKETVKEKTYTYNVSISSMPEDFNPHTVEGNEQNPISMYSQLGLVSTVPLENGGYIWAYDMAESITDITANFANKDNYQIKDGETGRVWQIKLNKNAVWEDGSKINADTYLKSMELLLDSNMKNTGANTYIDKEESKISIYNAINFYNNDLSGKANYDLIYDSQTKKYALGVEETDKMYISIDKPTSFWGYSLKDAYNAYGDDYFSDAKGTDYYKIIEKAVGDNEYVLVTTEILNAVKGICEVVGKGHKEEFMEMLFYQSGNHKKVEFSEVGLIKVDDYTFNYITDNSISVDEFYRGMLNNWIVKDDIYTSSLETEGNKTTSGYGTSKDSYLSYGPYKLKSVKDDKVVMVKNDKWYGYSEERYSGQYQTTHINVHIVKDASKAEQMFLSGKIDELILDDSDVMNYSDSERIYTVDGTGTYRWIFATDMDKLIAMEKNQNDGTNKRVLGYDDFRKALSYAVDRGELCVKTTANYKPAFYLLSNAYYIDDKYSKESMYRGQSEAMKALSNVYGMTYGDGGAYQNEIDAYNAITGYDVAKAKELFATVYDKAVADGNYTTGQIIKLRCVVSSAAELTQWEKNEEKLVNEMIAEATTGTGFEGKLSVQYICGVQNRYTDCVDGNIEMIKGAWGGTVNSPFITIGMYTVSEYAGIVHESCGFDPSTATLTVSYDFNGDGEVENVKKSYREWTLAMNDNSLYGQNIKARVTILSALEAGILSEYQCIPLTTETSSRLLSWKVEYGVDTYNVMCEYGGVRYMTYNYDDASFESYVKEQGGTLTY